MIRSAAGRLSHETTTPSEGSLGRGRTRSEATAPTSTLLPETPRFGLDLARIAIESEAAASVARHSASHTALEAEARQRANATGPTAPPRLRPVGATSSAHRRLVDVARRAGGRPMPESLRVPLEGRLGASLAGVRVNSSPEADTVARALGAHAWTFGREIGFSQGAFAPGTSAGQRRLLHESTHVLQQREATPVMQCEASGGVSFDFSVDIDEELDADALLLEFIRQYAGLRTRDEAIAAREAAAWHWSGTPRTATTEDVARGYVLIRVTDRSLAPVTVGERRGITLTIAGMGAKERAELHADADRRFWERTNYRPGERLGDSTDDRRMAEYWRHVRDQLVRTRQSILELPAAVRELLFDPGASRRLLPAEFDVALRVGRKLAAMSAVELAQWQSRITASTDDWERFEASLDAYLADQEAHGREQLELGRLSARLYGLEALYDLRRHYRRTSAVPTRDPYGARDTVAFDARADMREELDQALRQNGFETLADFDAAILDWRRGFERETVRVADLLLDQLDHVLYESQVRYGDAAQAAALARELSASGAPAHFARADREFSRSIALSRPVSAMIEHAVDEAGALAAAWESTEAGSSGESAVRALGAAHPLLSLTGFPARDLARTSPARVQSFMLDYIREHRNAVRDTRAEIHGDTNFIYRLNTLLDASFQAQGIEPDSIFDHIVRDHISKRQIATLVEGIALTLLALGLTIATLGGGALAVGAGATAFGIGAWQALDAFETYLRDQNAHDARLLSEDPSIAWVVLACVGAAVDLGGAVAAVRAIRPAAIAFNETGDIAGFRRALEALPDLDRRIQRAVLEGVEAQAQIRRQVQAIVAIGRRANDALGVGVEGGYRLMIIAWHGARRGLKRFDQFIAELRRARIVSEFSKLSPAEQSFLRGQFDEGLRRALEGFVPRSAMSAELRAAVSARAETADLVDEAAAFGRYLGLEDDTVLEVLESQARLTREVDPTAIGQDSLRRAMRQRADDAPDLRGRAALDAEHMAEEGRRGVRALPEEGHAVTPTPGGGGFSESQLGGEIGEALEPASAGARSLPPTYAQHIEPQARDDLRKVFSTHGQDALRVFTDRLGLPAHGLRQVEIPTGKGLRKPDRLVKEGDYVVLRETKRYVHQVLARTSRISEELAKDVAILERYPYAIVEWYLIGRVQGRFLDELSDLATRFPGRFRVVLADTHILRTSLPGALSRGSEAANALTRDLTTLAQQSETVVRWTISRRRIDADFLVDLRAAEAQFPGRFELRLSNHTEVLTP